MVIKNSVKFLVSFIFLLGSLLIAAVVTAQAREVIAIGEYVMGDSVRFTVKIKAEISNADIDANLKRAADERQTVAEYRKLKEEYERQSRDLSTLKKQLATIPVEQRKEVLNKIGENGKSIPGSRFT